MSKVDDGNTAFPFHITKEHIEGNDGMSLLDYFAAAALTGIMANRSEYDKFKSTYSEIAYSNAKAMIKTRYKVLSEQ